jgi:hypothetical protein
MRACAYCAADLEFEDDRRRGSFWQTTGARHELYARGIVARNAANSVGTYITLTRAGQYHADYNTDSETDADSSESGDEVFQESPISAEEMSIGHSSSSASEKMVSGSPNREIDLQALQRPVFQSPAREDSGATKFQGLFAGASPPLPHWDTFERSTSELAEQTIARTIAKLDPNRIGDGVEDEVKRAYEDLPQYQRGLDPRYLPQILYNRLTKHSRTDPRAELSRASEETGPTTNSAGLPVARTAGHAGVRDVGRGLGGDAVPMPGLADHSLDDESSNSMAVDPDDAEDMDISDDG